MYHLPFIEGGHLIMDESDSAYASLRGDIVNEAGSPYNFITIFEEIYRIVSERPAYSDFVKGFYKPRLSSPTRTADDSPSSPSKRDNALKEEYEGTEKTEGIRKEIIDFYKEYNFTGSFRGKKDMDGKDFRFFLFQSRINVSIIRNNDYKYASINPGSEFEDNNLFYAEQQPEQSGDLLNFIEKMSFMIDRFFRFLNKIGEAAHPLRSLIPDNHEASPAETSRVLLNKLFRINSEELEKRCGNKTILEDLLARNSYEGLSFGYVPIADSDDGSSIAAKGFQYTLIVNPTNSFATETKMTATRCYRTPERMLLSAAEEMNVLLVSATADVPSNICNFNLAFLSSASGYPILPEKNEVEEIIEDYSVMQQGNENIKVNVGTYGTTEQAYLADPLGEWKKAFGENSRLKFFSFQDDLAQFLTAHGIKLDLSQRTKNVDNKHVFDCLRLLKICDFFRQYWGHFCKGDFPSTLYFSNILLRKAVVTNYQYLPVLDKSNVLDFFDRIIATSGKKDADGQLYRAADVLIDINARNILERKITAQKRLMEGCPVFLCTSYNTASVGQNLQMKMPVKYFKNMELAGIVPLRKDNRFVEANHAMMGLETPTHLTYNFERDYRDFNELEIAARNAIFDVRSLADAGYISPSCEKTLLRDILNHLCHYRFKVTDNDVIKNPDIQDGDAEPDEEEAMSYLYGYMKMLRGCRGVRDKRDRIFMQAIGRMSRARAKFRDEYILFDHDGVFLCEWSRKELLTHEASACVAHFTALREKEHALPDHWSATALQKEERCRRWTDFLVKRLRQKELNNEEYTSVKRYIAGHLSISEKEYKGLSGSMQEFYVPTPGHETTFWYALRDNCHDIILKTISSAPCKGLSPISLETSRIETMLKVKGFRDYLDSKGVASVDDGNDYHITIYGFISFYMGYIGELFVEYILSLPGVGIAVEELPWDKFELFDYVFTDADRCYLDVKNWSPMSAGNSRLETNMVPHIVKKASECGARRIVYINAVADTSIYTPTEETFTGTDSDGPYSVEVLQIPALVNRKGEIAYRNIERIRTFVNK